MSAASWDERKAERRAADKARKQAHATRRITK